MPIKVRRDSLAEPPYEHWPGPIVSARASTPALIMNVRWLDGSGKQGVETGVRSLFVDFGGDMVLEAHIQKDLETLASMLKIQLHAGDMYIRIEGNPPKVEVSGHESLTTQSPVMFRGRHA